MVELLVTMLLISIMLVGLAALQVSSVRQVTQSKRAGEALRLAQRVIERYAGIDYAQVTPKPWGIELYPGTATQMANVAVNGTSAGPFTVWTLVEGFPPPAPPSGRIVTVQVIWRDLARGNQPPSGQYQIFDVTLATQRFP